MGQKVNPIGLRLGIVKKHDSNWYANKQNFPVLLLEDFKIRSLIKKRLHSAGVSKVNIERTSGNAKVIVHASRPGLIIGKKGSDIESLKKEITKLTKRDGIQLKIEEIKKPESNATLVAQNIAAQLEKRAMFRRVMKRAAGQAMKQGAKGVKICVAGRLGGAEIARKEWMKEGQVPLHTLRANIDYGFYEAKTTYGIIGIKVWIYAKKQKVKSNPVPKEAVKSQ